jgi:hypothetical protein
MRVVRSADMVSVQCVRVFFKKCSGTFSCTSHACACRSCLVWQRSVALRTVQQIGTSQA